MLECNTCSVESCLNCLHQWSYQQLLEGSTPRCPYCRHNISVTDMYNARRNLHPRTRGVIATLSTFIVNVWTFPPMSWDGYFTEMGWGPLLYSAPVDANAISSLTSTVQEDLIWLDDNFDWLDMHGNPSNSGRVRTRPEEPPPPEDTPEEEEAEDPATNTRRVRRRILNDRRSARTDSLRVNAR